MLSIIKLRNKIVHQRRNNQKLRLKKLENRVRAKKLNINYIWKICIKISKKEKILRILIKKSNLKTSNIICRNFSNVSLILMSPFRSMANCMISSQKSLNSLISSDLKELPIKNKKLTNTKKRWITTLLFKISAGTIKTLTNHAGSISTK